MQAGFSALDIVFLILLAVFIVSRFMGNQLPKDDKKSKKVLKFPEDVIKEVEKVQKEQKKKVSLKHLEGLSGVKLIEQADKDFKKKEFLSGAELAYQMYYDAINDKDEDTLEGMVAPRHFDEIMESVETLESENKKRFVLIEKIENVEIVEAKLHGRTAIIDVKYVAQQTDVIESEDLSEDDVEKAPSEVVSIWTWARSIDSEDLNWELERITLLS